jgi:membrane-associated protease RseP (regulator of RpoE activity)
MTRVIRVPTPIVMQRLTRVVQIYGTDVFVHWSVFLIAALMLVGAKRRPLETVVGLVCYLSVLFIHETGHLIAARRRGCEVFSMELYPIFGLVRYETPWSRFDHCVIAWGGVVAQAVVAIPIMVWIELRGFTHFDAANAALALLGPFSLLVAAFNLLPFGRLDGAVAWKLIPEFFRRSVSSRRGRQ